MLLVANFANTKLCIKLKNELTEMVFQKYLRPYALDESSLSILRIIRPLLHAGATATVGYP